MPRKKQRRAWGSVTEIKRGKKYVLRWMENTPEGRKRKTRTFYGTYREACNALDAVHAEAMKAGTADRTLTIGEVHDKWWANDIDARVKAGELKESSAASYKLAWRTHVAKRWADVPCDMVRQSDVQDWLDSMTRSTAAIAIAVAQQIMDVAVLREETQANKFRVKYRMPKGGGKRTKDVLTIDEADRVLENLRGSLLEPAYILACFGSCRVSESLAVMVDEVRFEARDAALFAVATIHRQAAKNGLPREVGDMKNEQSNRIIVIPPPYSARLREIVAERIEDGIDWISHKGDGMPFSLGMASNLWRKQWPEFGIEGKQVTMQNLRPTWRTVAEGRWGIRSRLLEILMGHKLEGVSGKHYIRPDDELIVDMFVEDFLAKNATT